ncbi:diacylglycerol O-acyltransferase [Plasmodium vinckei petteri]|uniref:O-acyltransferase n=1 Tax=Plasmodium vinckei petteri TaxID=138298 RepID=W7AL36_PLAVN|nr:diacylglycerol O-acyltransferase [Plasmodium vinckei petteri]CAD2109522.1 diacylglycerol O-acyltransferase, putative [Plasmodium vinckei petteri]
MNDENDKTKKYIGRPLFENLHKKKQISLLTHKLVDTNLKGFCNLFLIIIIIINFRIILENIKKYGFDSIPIPSRNYITKNLPILICFICLYISIVFSWIIERYFFCWICNYFLSKNGKITKIFVKDNFNIDEACNNKLPDYEFSKNGKSSQIIDESTSSYENNNMHKRIKKNDKDGVNKLEEQDVGTKYSNNTDQPNTEQSKFNENTEGKINEWKYVNFSIFLLRCINSMFMLIFPYMVVMQYEGEPILASILLTTSIVWFFKTYSFHHVCYDTRKLYIEGTNLSTIDDSLGDINYIKSYPYCLQFKNYYTYIFMPTMCFQYTYPRTEKIDWKFVFKHMTEAIISLLIINIITNEYILVIIEQTFKMKEFKSPNLTIQFIHIMESMLKVSILTIYTWMLGFFVLFHNWCNVLAEITKFGDRLFYKDWWNASSFGEYWRKWNLPVYYFVYRHVNRPLIYYGVSRKLSMIIIFIISALLHEYLVTIPLKIKFSGYIFFFFTGQIPLMHLTNSDYFKKNKNVGNLLFWIVFCIIGQPLILFTYYYSWTHKKIELP